MATVGREETVAAAPAPGLLSLAGDALCLAVAALRLSPAVPPEPEPEPEPEPRPPPPQPAELPEVSLDEVAWHDHIQDCWSVVYDRVYDLTAFLREHPGGEEILLEHAGRDATLAFAGIGHGPAMLRALRPYLVGALPVRERIYSGAAAERGVLQLLALGLELELELELS